VPPAHSYTVPTSAPFISDDGDGDENSFVHIQGSKKSGSSSGGGAITSNNDKPVGKKTGKPAVRLFEVMHRLGPVQSVPPVESAVLLHRVPRAWQIIISEVPDPELPAAEMLLARGVRDILESDEYAGSTASSHIQNMCQYMPGYEAVIGSGSMSGGSGGAIHPCWNTFVDAHTGREWCALRYTQPMLDSMRLGSGGGAAGASSANSNNNNNNNNTSIKVGEPRLVSWTHLARFMEADLAREQLRRSCETEIREQLLADMQRREMTQTDVQQALAQSRAFLSTLSPQLVKILAVMEQDPRYVVLKHRLHPITVERNRDVADTIAERKQQQKDEEAAAAAAASSGVQKEGA
jgi:hypothetical protein